jgi:hypothetical protein
MAEGGREEIIGPFPFPVCAHVVEGSTVSCSRCWSCSSLKSLTSKQIQASGADSEVRRRLSAAPEKLFSELWPFCRRSVASSNKIRRVFCRRRRGLADSIRLLHCWPKESRCSAVPECRFRVRRLETPRLPDEEGLRRDRSHFSP